LPNRDIIVIGASFGGLDALCTVLRELPRDLPASIFVVMHVGGASALGSILDRCGPMPVVEAREGEKIEGGRAYVALSDRHLLLNNGQISLSRGPRENRHRPAIDPLFRSARGFIAGGSLASSSRGLDDGSAGLFAVKSRGGIVIVQDPLEALDASMPRSALRNVDVDHCVPLAEMPALLVKLTHSPIRLSQKTEKRKETSAT
jgi:two-component system, chemotaxis family, protein-glutamate methylesterase/glutaminase